MSLSLAPWGEVALVGGAVGIGEGVVEVAVAGLVVAGGGGAGLGAGVDEVPEPAAGYMPGTLVTAEIQGARRKFGSETHLIERL